MKKKISLISVILILIALFFYFGLHNELSFESIKAKQSQFEDFKSQNYVLSLIVFCLIYIVSTALSFPGAALLTLLGGALFGLFIGTLAVSFSSTMGATLSFLTSRFLLKESLEKKFKSSFNKINQGIEKEGAFYLFSLRLIPLFPFFLVNLVMGLTKMKTQTYMWVSALGMLPGTFAYVNAGTQLSSLNSPSGILSPVMIGSFALLGVIPFLSKKLIERIRSKKDV